ncbi:transposase family protein [Arachnia propionica]|uniref:transposase family protein n=1 Tax=Arachnia propionica TaxID=1750 RepID=UPI003C6FFDD9
MHDAKVTKESGFLTTLNAQSHIGDKGYIGLGMITPVKKPTHGELTDSDRRNNTAINRVRYLIERVIANVKTWRVLHTDYRRPCNTFETTIQAVTGLIFAYTL